GAGRGRRRGGHGGRVPLRRQPGVRHHLPDRRGAGDLPGVGRVSGREVVMTGVVEFYRGHAPDAEGRRLQDIWNWSDEELEVFHDYIQWLLPLSDPSRFYPDASLLSCEEVAAF